MRLSLGKSHIAMRGMASRDPADATLRDPTGASASVLLIGRIAKFDWRRRDLEEHHATLNSIHCTAMTILVTGAGLLGLHIAEQLHRRGDSFVLADIRPGQWHTRSAVHEVAACDVSDLEALLALIDRHGVTRIIHTAAVLAVAARNTPRAAVQVNILGTANVLEAARMRKLARAVVASSTTVTYAVFDDFQGESIPEDFSMKAVSQGPRSFYSFSKLASEHLCTLYRAQHGVNAVVLRYGALLGALDRADEGLVARLALTFANAGPGGRAVLDDARLVWQGVEEFLDPRDAAAATVTAAMAANELSPAYHIASNEALSLQQFVARAAAVFPGQLVEVTTQPAGGFTGFPYPRPARTDISAAVRDLSFAPQHDVGSSLLHTKDMLATIQRV